MSTNTIVSCESQEEYDLLMQWAEENKYKWRDGSLATAENYYCSPDSDEEYENGFGIFLCSDKHIEYSSIDYYRHSGDGYPIDISFEDFSNEHIEPISTIEF